MLNTLSLCHILIYKEMQQTTNLDVQLKITKIKITPILDNLNKRKRKQI